MKVAYLQVEILFQATMQMGVLLLDYFQIPTRDLDCFQPPLTAFLGRVQVLVFLIFPQIFLQLSKGNPNPMKKTEAKEIVQSWKKSKIKKLILLKVQGSTSIKQTTN